MIKSYLHSLFFFFFFFVEGSWGTSKSEIVSILCTYFCFNFAVLFFHLKLPFSKFTQAKITIPDCVLFGAPSVIACKILKAFDGIAEPL